MEYNRLEKFKRYLRPLILIIIVIGILGGLYFASHNKVVKSGVVTTSKGEVKSQKITLNQTFDLIISSKQNDLQPLKITFGTAQLTNKITISKKSKFSAKGTKFLMINLLIENGNTKRINLKTRDIIRLIDNNNKKFAPRYYNKEVAIEADSVKKDTIGFLVPEDIKEFKIQYGLPTTADKKILELKFE